MSSKKRILKTRLYTAEQRFSHVHWNSVAITCIFITGVLAFITVFAFSFRKKTKSYYGKLAETRIDAAAAEVEKNVDLAFKECFQDLSYMKAFMENEDFSTDDKINTALKKLDETAVKYDYLIQDFGILQNGKIHMDNVTDAIPYSYSVEGNRIYVDGNSIYFISESDIPGIEGITGRLSITTESGNENSFTALLTSDLYDGEASLLILNQNYDELVISSPNYRNLFSGNLKDDVTKWNMNDTESFAEYAGGTDKITEIAQNGTSILMYKEELEYNDECGSLLFLFIVPKTKLTNQLVDLTYISLSALYTTLTVFSVLLILLYIAFIRMYLMSLKKRNTDEKTGLKNESSFFHDAMALLLKEESEYGIITMNIKNFKRINAIYGAIVADGILITVGNVLKEYYGNSKEDIAGYQHGDNYLLFLKGNKDEILYKLEDLKATLASHNYDNNITLAFTFGIKMTKDASELHREFDCARFAEKSGGSENGILFYDEALEKKQAEADDLIARFDKALENREFEVYFQLKWNLEKNDWGGCEALVRWHDPERGLISPGRFIPLFEENGYITRLDLYVFESVCEHISQMLDNGERCVPVSFNLSKRNFADLSFIPVYEEIVEKYKVPHDLIEFEITEGLLMENVSSYKKFISIIHDAKYSISMDDFGAGYSSLNMIHQLDFDVIKIDAKFFRGGLDNSNMTIVETIIELCHKLGKIVVAEGIEQANEVEFLRKCSCDLIQGYYFAKPMPFNDFRALLHSNEK